MGWAGRRVRKRKKGGAAGLWVATVGRSVWGGEEPPRRGARGRAGRPGGAALRKSGPGSLEGRDFRGVKTVGII